MGALTVFSFVSRLRSFVTRSMLASTACWGAVRDGDVLVVTKLDRLGRSARDLSCGVKRNHKQVPFSCNTRAFSRYDALNTHQHRWIEVKR